VEGEGVPGSSRDRSGGDTGSVSTEYVLVVAFILLAAAMAIGLLGAAVLSFFSRGGTDIPWEG
jgi:Flp pilus assembly pilin Flp